MLANLIAIAALVPFGFAFEAPFQDLTFDQALATAKKDGKIVMIDFFTTWCVPCKKLDKLTWPDPGVQKWLAEKTVPLRMDAEKEVVLAKRFGVVAYPTIAFVRADGSKMDAMVGYKDPETFLETAKTLLSGKSSLEIAREKFAGHENNPTAREQFAKELARAGQLEEALSEYLWCFDHGNDSAWNGFHGVRVSFLLSDIVNLGRKYPPAIKALEERRDKAESAVLSGKGSWDDANDMAALNKNLNAPERTLSVYDRLKKENHLDRRLKEIFLDDVADPMVVAKRYGELVEDTGDVDKRVNRGLERLEKRPPHPAGEDEDLRKAMEAAEVSLRDQRLRELYPWYEALVGAGKYEKASSLAERFVAIAPAGSTYAALIERALRANAPDAARVLADRGRSSLPDKEKATLEEAAKKIPVAK